MIDFDFHTHSNYSSCATQTPEQLVRKAFSAGIKVLSLTDHDCIDGITECRNICESYDISLINGVELSASSNKITHSIPNNTGLHILGYRISLDKKIFNAGFEVKDEKSRLRNNNLFEYLRKKGYLIEISEEITEQKIKEQLVKKGYFIDKKQAKSFLNAKDILENFPKERLSIQQAISLIHTLGGIAIWAHPYNAENHIDLSNNQINELFEYMVSLGIDGLEAFHCSNLPVEKISYLLNLAQKAHIGVSLGSDRHFCDDRYGTSYFSMEKEIIKMDYDFDLIKQFVVGGNVK